MKNIPFMYLIRKILTIKNILSIFITLIFLYSILQLTYLFFPHFFSHSWFCFLDKLKWNYYQLIFHFQLIENTIKYTTKEVKVKEAKAKEQTNKQTTPYSIFHYTKWEELCHLFVISPFLYFLLFFWPKYI